MSNQAETKVVPLSQVMQHLKDYEGGLTRAIGNAELSDEIDMEGRTVEAYFEWLIKLEKKHCELYQVVKRKAQAKEEERAG